MATSNQMIEIFDTCVNRLADGEQVETILLDYPEIASDLRPMLEVGLLFPKVRFPAAEVALAQKRVQAQVDTALGGSSAPWWVGGSLSLMIIVAIVALGAIVMQGGSSENSVATEIPHTEVVTTSTFVPLVYVEGELQFEDGLYTVNGLELDVSDITSLPEIGEVVTVSGEIDNNRIVATQIDTVSPFAVSETRIVIEGAVETISPDTITIYGIEIAKDSENPMFDVLQLGDVLRIEGEIMDEDGISIIIIVNVVYINVEVFVNGDMVWRDSGTCQNPPPAWAEAHGWRNRCTSAPSNTSRGSGRSRGNSGGS